MKSPQKQHIHHIIFICLLMVVGWGQECEDGYSEIDGDCYYQSDLDVLQDFIGLNESLNDEEPLEIGDQEWNNKRLTYLGLGNKSLTTIPDNIGNLNHLEYLFLSSNQLSILPESIGDLSSLKFLFLSHNQFSILPESIGNLSNLETLYLHDNQLNILPETICNLSDCYIYVNDNQLCPPYLECIEDYVGSQDTSNCEEPSLCNEETEVELWGFCFTITLTSYLNLSGYGLSGEIPSEIENLIYLTVIDLGSNQLSGEIPSEIGNLTNLTILDLGGNQLSGEIPLEIFNLTNLTELELGGNQLSGEIPSVIGNLNNLTFLHLEYNQFSGEIPSELWNQVNLNWLNLVHNQFFGTISSNICTLNMNWSNPDNFNIYDNQLCPPYPVCIEDYVGEQDTSNCSSMSISELTLPVNFQLHQPFPNPFNPTTSISFSISEQSQTSLKVYDITGNLISTLLNQTMNVGNHQIEWNGENLSSGTYFIRINSGEFFDVKKVVLVK